MEPKKMHSPDDKANTKTTKKRAVNLLQAQVDDFDPEDKVPKFSIPAWVQPEQLQMIINQHLSA